MTTSASSPPACPAPARRPRPRGLAAVAALPAGFAGLMIIGACAAAAHGGVSARWVLVLAAAVVLAGAAVAELPAAAVLAVLGWLTIIGFSQAPYAQLRLASPRALMAFLIVAAFAVAGLAAGALARRLASRCTLWIARGPGVPGLEETRWPTTAPRAG